MACSVCLMLAVQPTTLVCGHTSCRACLAKWYFASKTKVCPLCRQPYHGLPMVNIQIRWEYFLHVNITLYSTKDADHLIFICLTLLYNVRESKTTTIYLLLLPLQCELKIKKNCCPFQMLRLTLIVLFRSMIRKLYPEKAKQREEELEADEEAKSLVAKYDKELRENESSSGDTDMASFCAGILIAICTFIVSFLRCSPIFK